MLFSSDNGIQCSVFKLISFLVSFLQCVKFLSRFPPHLHTFSCLQVSPLSQDSPSEWTSLSSLTLLSPALDPLSPTLTDYEYICNLHWRYISEKESYWSSKQQTVLCSPKQPLCPQPQDMRSIQWHFYKLTDVLESLQTSNLGRHLAITSISLEVLGMEHDCFFL